MGSFYMDDIADKGNLLFKIIQLAQVTLKLD